MYALNDEKLYLNEKREIMVPPKTLRLDEETFLKGLKMISSHRGMSSLKVICNKIDLLEIG